MKNFMNYISSDEAANRIDSSFTKPKIDLRQSTALMALLFSKHIADFNNKQRTFASPIVSKLIPILYSIEVAQLSDTFLRQSKNHIRIEVGKGHSPLSTRNSHARDSSSSEKAKSRGMDSDQKNRLFNLRDSESKSENKSEGKSPPMTTHLDSNLLSASRFGSTEIFSYDEPPRLMSSLPELSMIDNSIREVVVVDHQQGSIQSIEKEDIIPISSKATVHEAVRKKTGFFKNIFKGTDDKKKSDSTSSLTPVGASPSISPRNSINQKDGVKQ